jgi:hypothetical protein
MSLITDVPSQPFACFSSPPSKLPLKNAHNTHSSVGIHAPSIKRPQQFQQFVKVLMFFRSKPRGCDFTAVVVYAPPQPDLIPLNHDKNPAFRPFQPGL